MTNVMKTSVRVDIDPTEYDDPMVLLEDAFWEAAALVVPEGEVPEILGRFFTVRFDDNGGEFSATVTATEKKS